MHHGLHILVGVYEELNNPDKDISKLKLLTTQLESPSFLKWKRNYRRNAKKKEIKKKKQLLNKMLKEQNKKRGVLLAKTVEEWSTQKDQEAKLKQNEDIKNKLRTKEELEERLTKQTLHKNKLKVIVKLEKLRILRLNKQQQQQDSSPSSNKTLLSKIKELQQETLDTSIQPDRKEDENKEETKDSEISRNIGAITPGEEEINKFYSQAYSSIESLIHTRRSWDIYIVNENGHKIPQYLPSEFPLIKHSNWDSWLYSKM